MCNIYPDTLEGKRDLINDIIGIMEFTPHKRSDGVICNIVRNESNGR